MGELVSIIIPTYNRSYCIENTLDSILAQTYSNWEIVVVDDGSTDETQQILKGYASSSVINLKQENRGPSAARNLGLANASGQWVAYIDSDNELFPNYLDVMLDSLKKNPNVLYALPMGKRTLELYKNKKLIQLIDDSKDFLDTIGIKDIFHRNFHFDCNGFMHAKNILTSDIKWDEELGLMEDWDFAMTLAKEYPDNFLYVSHELFHYHQRFGGDGLVSNAKYSQWAEAFEYIYQKHKSAKGMKGQNWYPNRVEKYLNLQKKFENGEVPEPYLRYFL